MKREDQGVEKKGSMVGEGRIRGIRRECNRTTGREDQKVGKVGSGG